MYEVFNKQTFLMQKINKAAIGKNQEIVGLKILILRLHYITMYFADIEFPYKERMTTQVFAFSSFKKQTPRLSSRLPCNLDTDYRRKSKWGLDLIYQVLPCTATFKLIRLVGIIKKIHIDDLIMTAWWAMKNFQNIKWGPDLQHACKDLDNEETIFLFHIKYRLLQFIRKTVDISHSKESLA